MNHCVQKLQTEKKCEKNWQFQLNRSFLRVLEIIYFRRKAWGHPGSWGELTTPPNSCASHSLPPHPPLPPWPSMLQASTERFLSSLLFSNSIYPFISSSSFFSSFFLFLIHFLVPSSSFSFLTSHATAFFLCSLPFNVWLISPSQGRPTCCARKFASAGNLEDAEEDQCREGRLSPHPGLFVYLFIYLFVWAVLQLWHFSKPGQELTMEGASEEVRWLEISFNIKIRFFGRQRWILDLFVQRRRWNLFSLQVTVDSKGGGRTSLYKGGNFPVWHPDQLLVFQSNVIFLKCHVMSDILISS